VGVLRVVGGSVASTGSTVGTEVSHQKPGGR
jgi:hypothetical protein